MIEQLRLTLLGGLQITLGGSPVTDFTSKKAPALLSYLSVAEGPHTRESLSGLLWGDSSEKRARASLRTVLWDLRQNLAPFLVVERQRVTFKRDSAHWLDILDFSQHIETALPNVAADGSTRDEDAMLTPEQLEALQTAVSLYHGDFLAGFYVTDAPAFEEWVLKKREWARHLAIQALHRLIGHHTAQGTHQAGIDTATRLLEIAPWKEEAHRQLMTLLALSGQRSAALAQYETCAHMLDEELGVEPTAETRFLYEQIRSGQLLEDEEEGRPQLIRSDRPASRRNFPSPVTALIGRQEELAELTRELLNPERRLVTLAGADGVGKTRLALAAAEALAEKFDQGVCFVSLREDERNDEGMFGLVLDVREADGSSALARRSRLATAVGRALGATLSGSAPAFVQLLDYLRHRNTLVVIDDVGGPPSQKYAIAELCKRALYVTLLVVAREPLDLDGEHVLSLAGLSVPPGSSGLSPDTVLGYEAVELFVQRAGLDQEVLRPRNDGGRDIVRICRAVDGAPLGIELLAAWAGQVSLGGLAHGVQRIVTRTASSAPELSSIERGVRSAFAYTWRRLPPATRRNLVHLSIFQDGFDGRAAAAVAGIPAGDLNLMVDRALLSRPVAGRYAWHPLLRELARARLNELHADPAEEAAAAKKLRDRHAAHYIDVMAEQTYSLVGQQPMAAASEIGRDWANIRRAWYWALDQGDLDLLSMGLRALSRYLLLRGPLWEGDEIFGAAARTLSDSLDLGADPEGRKLVSQLLVEQAQIVNRQAQYDRAYRIATAAIDLVPMQPDAGSGWSELEASAHLERGKALWSQGHYAPAREELEQALSGARDGGTKEVAACARLHLGLVAMDQDCRDEARDAFRQALKLYRQQGDRRHEAKVITHLGALALDQRRYVDARSQLEEALRLHQAVGDRRGESATHTSLARLFDAQAEYGLANTHGERAVRIARDIGDQQAEARALTILGLSLLHEGKNEAAWNRSLQAVELARALGDRAGAGRALTVLGHAFAELEMLEEAIQTYEMALTLQRDLGQAGAAAESLAGLARLSLDGGDLPRAQAYVEEIWTRLGRSSLEGTAEPLRVYLTCYQVLRASEDPRANAVLSAASDLFDGTAHTSRS